MVCWRCGISMVSETIRYPSGLTLERWACPVCGERRPYEEASMPRLPSYQLPPAMPAKTRRAIRILQASGDVIVVVYPNGSRELVLIP